MHILAFIDDPRTLVRASMVSRAWQRLVADEWLWKRMCAVWRFLDEEGIEQEPQVGEEPLVEMEQYAELTLDPALEWLTARKREAQEVRLGDLNIVSPPLNTRSYKRHFKDSYITSMSCSAILCYHNY